MEIPGGNGREEDMSWLIGKNTQYVYNKEFRDTSSRKRNYKRMTFFNPFF